MRTGKLVLLRHGQSTWNLQNLFTGWVDVDLSDQGTLEAQEAARLLRDEGIAFDLAFTSVLKRAIRTLAAAMAEVKPDLHIPVDSPAMNWHLAKAAKALGAPVLYYIAPQVWAWAPWRCSSARAGRRCSPRRPGRSFRGRW